MSRPPFTLVDFLVMAALGLIVGLSGLGYIELILWLRS